MELTKVKNGMEQAIRCCHSLLFAPPRGGSGDSAKDSVTQVIEAALHPSCMETRGAVRGAVWRSRVPFYRVEVCAFK